MKRLFISLAVNIFSLGLFAQGSGVTGQEKWLSFETEIYTINYPDSFTVNQQQPGMEFMLISPQATDTDKFRENVNLIKQDLTGLDINLGDYVRISESQILEMLTNGEITESTRLGSGRLMYHKLTFTGEQGGVKFLFVQFYWVIGTDAYALTFTCEHSQYAAYQDVGEAIMKSFRFK